MYTRDKMGKYFFRRDNAFCHECRFCCTLSICTNKDGTYFRDSSEKSLQGAENKVFITFVMWFIIIVSIRMWMLPQDIW